MSAPKWIEAKRGDVGFALLCAYAIGYIGGFVSAILGYWLLP